MKNLTMRMDENILREARRIALERGTTVSAMIREYLDGLVMEEDRKDRARREILEMCQNSTAEIGRKDWSREDLHDR
jgi:hypothetical protein